MNTQQIELLQSRKSDDWATPDYLYRQLDQEFNFNLDPCPLCADFDGLSIPWEGNIFVNPPYSRVKEFLKKAYEELRGGERGLLYSCFSPIPTPDGFTITFTTRQRSDFSREGCISLKTRQEAMQQ